MRLRSLGLRLWLRLNSILLRLLLRLSILSDSLNIECMSNPSHQWVRFLDLRNKICKRPAVRLVDSVSDQDESSVFLASFCVTFAAEMWKFHCNSRSFGGGRQAAFHVANDVLEVRIVEFTVVQTSLRNSQLVKKDALELCDLDLLFILNRPCFRELELSLKVPEF